MKININTQVKFIMTQAGYETYENWAKDFTLKINIPPVGEQVTMSLWEVMQIFGQEMYMGTTKQIFEHNELDFMLEDIAQVY